ncbi:MULTISPECIES: glutathione S-transferase family protein [Ferrimonas]|uniref:glutathione S-transferase family protein n=1 Tax=Ferrimonas TaxID=44011 RepID=UPI0004247388|nr:MULTISPECIES: glutathione S-transferase C-terminal domain-containing protein [Ferrimonas]
MMLYYSDASPFARLARVVARELAMEGVNEIRWSPFDDETRLHNPLGKIPFLIIRDRQVLFDSDVICRYFDSEWGNQTLFLPLAHHWGRQSMNALLQGLLETAVALRIEHSREDEGSASPFWNQRHRDTLHQGLTVLASQLSLLPEEWSILDIKLVCLLEYLDFRHPGLGWRKHHPRLKTWLESVKDRPSLIATRPH